jgi:lincosamide nucleotidyltransferase
MQHVMIDRFTHICEQDTRLDSAMLYGSFATGEADQYSDIDVMLYDISLAEIDQLAQFY